MQGGDTSSIREAGLPNITGEFSGVGNNNESPYKPTVKGAIYVAKSGVPKEGVPIANNGEKDDCFGFDASRSNSVYGKATTVQPPAITLIPQLRY